MPFCGWNASGRFGWRIRERRQCYSSGANGRIRGNRRERKRKPNGGRARKGIPKLRPTASGQTELS